MMKDVCCFLLVSVCVAGCASTHKVDWAQDVKPVGAEAANDSSVQTLVAEGDAQWALRSERSHLEAALAKWSEAAGGSSQPELLVKLARGHYVLGDAFFALEGDEVQRDRAYQNGLEWATKALKLSAPAFAQAMAAGSSHASAIHHAGKEAVPAMYWYATNLGKWAASKGFATRLRYKDDVKSTMDRIRELDEKFFYAASWRYMGAYEAVTAGIAGGDLKKSRDNFERAVALAPMYLGTKVLWAEYLCTKTQDRAMYQKLLEEVLAADVSVEPEIAQDNLLEQKRARKLLEKIDDNF